MGTREGRLTGRRILIVEDHADSREMMRQLLEHEGAAILDTASADSAILAMYAEAVDVVLTDVSLRGAAHDGVWLLREVRGTERLARIPIVAITGHKERETELRQLGFAAVLIKPFEPLELCTFIVGCLPPRTGPR
jgi:CheY-like chemotaxis protein